MASKMVYKEKVTTPTSWMSKPVILQRPNGNYIVIWEEDISNETANIYFREYSEDGVSLTQEIKANDSPAFAATEITASMDSSGNFIIVWEDGKNLQAQRFYSDLSKKGNVFQINSLETGNNIYPHVRLHKGKIYTAWNKSLNSSSVFSVWMNILDFDNPVSVQSESTAPQEFSLSQNYPNPFNPSTTIKYSIPSVGEGLALPLQVTLKIYDVLGREVATLVNEEQAAGNYEVQFNVEQASGLSSGVYFYKLQSGSFSETKKMILLR